MDIILPERISIEEAYMSMAEVWAKRSYATRAHVGALIVKDNQIISDGYNGMPIGFPNEQMEFVNEQGNVETSPLALHAESNALLKMVRNGSGISSLGADMYVTLSPCVNCAKLIIQAQIKRVFYRTQYRITDSFPILKQAGIEVIHLPYPFE